MTINNENMLNSILESFDRIEHIHSDDIPNIDLYMDQVTTFMDKRLRKTTRDPKEDKILTKTMINNYAKNDLLPPPIKKKYSKEHILVLIFIYYFKGILSINDIQTIMKPITDQFFDTTDDFDLEEIYNELFSFSKANVDVMKRDVAEKFAMSEEMFGDAPKKSKDFLKTFSFICMLGFDVYVKKLLIEKLVDGLREQPQKSEPGKKMENKKTDKKTEVVRKSEPVKNTDRVKKTEGVSKKAPSKTPETVKKTENTK